MEYPRQGAGGGAFAREATPFAGSSGTLHGGGWPRHAETGRQMREDEGWRWVHVGPPGVASATTRRPGGHYGHMGKVSWMAWPGAVVPSLAQEDQEAAAIVPTPCQWTCCTDVQTNTRTHNPDGRHGPSTARGDQTPHGGGRRGRGASESCIF